MKDKAVYTLRPLVPEDVGRVMDIIDMAKRNMRENLQIDQWQAGYPNAESFLRDAGEGRGVVLCENGTVVGVCAVIRDGEPTYEPSLLTSGDGEFPGKWLSGEGHYAAIHRVCIDLARTCRGLGSYFLQGLMETLREEGFTSVRIDTHRGNAPMRALLYKNGFVPTGIIRISDPNTPERIAYERCI